MSPNQQVTFADNHDAILNLLNRANYLTVNNIYGEGPAPLATFLAPVAGIANVDPSRQVQFVVKLLF